MATVENNLANEGADIARCAHSGCTCKVEPGQTYCCSDCEEQSDNETCYCGHADCVPEVKDEDGVL
ncbi:MAG: hypothetical protein ACXV8P_05815 [Methylobacter sp.]